MKSEAGGSWIVLAVDRWDAKHLLLDKAELSAIPPQDFGAIVSGMKDEGMSPVLNDSGEWIAIDFHEDFSPYCVPRCIRELARYIPSGTVVTMDNGCLPSVEWRFNGAAVEAFEY